MKQNIETQNIELPKSIKAHKGRIFIDRNKVYCSFKLNKKEYLSRVLIDKNNIPQFISGFDFVNAVAPGEIGDNLPNNGFISKDALNLWEEFLYTVTPTEIKRLSDESLIKTIKSNSYGIFEDFFS